LVVLRRLPRKARRTWTMRLSRSTSRCSSAIHSPEAAEHVSEGEIVERALRAADLRALVGRIRGRSNLYEDAAMRLVNEELKAVRA